MTPPEIPATIEYVIQIKPNGIWYDLKGCRSTDLKKIRKLSSVSPGFMEHRIVKQTTIREIVL